MKGFPCTTCSKDAMNHTGDGWPLVSHWRKDIIKFATFAVDQQGSRFLFYWRITSQKREKDWLSSKLAFPIKGNDFLRIPLRMKNAQKCLRQHWKYLIRRTRQNLLWLSLSFIFCLRRLYFVILQYITLCQPIKTLLRNKYYVIL